MTVHVLVVEDQEDNRRILRDLLTAHGFAFLEAVTGEEGVRMAVEHSPQLILLDIQLPDIDGYEVARRLKADDRVRNIPLIAVTSYALSGDEVKARQAGCDDYIAKPYSPRAMLGLVRQYTGAAG